MTSLNVLTDVISPLQIWFDKPIAQGKAEIYDEVLRGYSPAVLKTAIKMLKREWKLQSMPQPAIIKDLCDTAAVYVSKQGESNVGDLNFGERPNAQLCSCGKHAGIGSGSAEARAKTYHWYRSRRPNEYESNKRAYLDSYEQAHGVVERFLFQ